MFYQTQRGFTRIELIILITFFIVAAAWSGVSILKERKVARDATRVSDIKIIRNGIERYFAANQKYPSGAGIALGALARPRDCVALPCAYLTKESEWVGRPEAGETIFGFLLPTDPSKPDTRCDGFTNEDPCNYTYYEAPDGGYQLYFYLERGVGGLPAGHCLANRDGIKCRGE